MTRGHGSEPSSAAQSYRALAIWCMRGFPRSVGVMHVRAADRARIVQRFQLAASASIFMGAQVNEAADRFFDAISKAAAEDYGVFDEVIAQVEGLERESYHPMMIAAEALAACLLRSDDYAPVVRGWAHRAHPIARTAAVAAYSKAAEFDSGKVDFDALGNLISRLDAAPSDDDEVTRMYLGRLACKLRATDGGARLIEDMASRIAPFRITAAQAIASDLSTEAPERHLEVLRNKEPTRPSSQEPSRRFFWLFLSLLHDADPSVSQSAQYALELIRNSWPDLWKRLVIFRGPSMVMSPIVHEPGSIDTQFPDDARAAVEAALAELRERTDKTWTLDELADLTPRDLDRLRGQANNPRGVQFALHAPRESNMQWGVLTWDPEMLEEDQQAEAAGEEPIRVDGAPRLFISYRWSQAVDTSGGIDFFVGSLFNRGYDLVFDRDPRHLQKQLSAGDVLLLLYSCTHFVVLLTDELVDYLAETPRANKSPIDLELELARKLVAEGKLHWVPVHMDSPHPSEELFPTRQFQVIATFNDGHQQGSEAIERRHVRAAIAQARAMQDVVEVNVHDVT
jgi:hypothetical protein